jgi:Eco57I restriction-modification methylase/restriction endonuclease TaqI-like protein/restriction-modification enzyme MmeI-like protein
MPLFNKKYIKKQIGDHPAPISEGHFQILNDWSQSIKDGSIFTQKETALHGSFKSKIVEQVLGYKDFTTGDEWSVAAEEKIGRGEVDLALGIFTKETSQIIAPFELKGAKTKDLDAIMPGRNKSPVQQAWQYANGVKGCSWVLVCNYTELRLYSYATGNQEYEVFYLKDLVDPAEYARFQMLLSAESLINGRTLEYLAASQREEKDITAKLYADYKEIRHNLIDQVQLATPGTDGETQIAYAQTILDRVLFIAFAEDTGLLPQHSLKNAFEHADPYNPKPVWDNFKGLFKAIDKGNPALKIPRYNGGLFKRHPAIDKLKLPDLVCEGFKRLGDYDFASEVSVTILGHIFEQSITDLERLQAISRGEEVAPEKKTGTTGKRKLAGVVYTPDYIARFIVAQTVGAHLRELFDTCLKKNITKDSYGKPYEDVKWRNKDAELKTWTDYQKALSKLRIVDPACGSGVFLVTAFDYLKDEYHRVNIKVADLSGQQPDLFDPDSEILSKNLFGVDVNAESVEITKLSLWLKTARRGKVLDSLDDHLCVGDSIIEDSNYAYMEHGFSWKAAFPKVFNDGGFDIVLGNPPYVRQELISPMKPYLEKQFEVYHGVADLYCYFFERGVRLLKDGGRVGYISNATFFKTASGKPLRKFLSEKTTLETIVNFGDTQVFEGVTTYPAIMVMKSQTTPKKHNLSFWNVDELPKANFSEAFDNLKAEYAQNNLTSEAWELEDERLTILRQKIKKGKKTLKEVYGSPYRGILTGRNEAFVIDQTTRDRLIVEDAKSAEIIKPFLEGKDLKRWRSESRDLFLIFTRRGIEIENYPAILKHLEQYHDILEPKPKDWKGDKWQGRKPGPYKWYEIQDSTNYYRLFEAPKILYGEFSSNNIFSMDKRGWHPNNKCYLIPSPCYFLLGYLNSKAFWYHICGETVFVRGHFYQMHSVYLENSPIPKATDAQKAELAEFAKACQDAAEARYAKQQSITRRIPDLCPDGNDPKLSNKLKSWWEFEDFKAFQKEIKSKFKQDIPLSERTEWEDWIAAEKTEINRLTAEIKAHEAKINALVYQLFDLTDEEIKLLEANI